MEDLDLELRSDPENETLAQAENHSNKVLDLTLDEDRYSRLRLIPWWDQEKLASARVMVVGAGALGNEILKNLALLGIGQIYIVDFDSIENSNLSRSVLYRASDEGKSKSEISAAAVKDINPDCHVHWINGNIVYDVGLGLFRRMDVVIGGLDNREARLAINQACWKVGTPWIDGAIEVLFGIARVFVPPHTPCYECTMTEQDYKLLNMRRSCALLSREEMLTGKVPTTPTTSSIIAGIQVQEAIKLIHSRSDLPTLAGRGYFFNGLTHDSYIVNYEYKEDCPSHETFDNIVELNLQSSKTTLKTILGYVQDHLGSDAVLEFGKEIVTELQCQHCHTDEQLFKILGQVTENEGRCHVCGSMRMPRMTHTITGSEPFLDLTLAEIGLPPFDIVTGRSGLEMVHIELTGDLKYILGVE